MFVIIKTNKTNTNAVANIATMSVRGFVSEEDWGY